jgi:hypothetical protein
MTDFVDGVYDQVDNLAVALDDYGAYLDAATNTLNRIINYPPFGSPDQYAIVNSVIDLIGALTNAVEVVSEDSDQSDFTTHTVAAEASVYEIAQELYNDSVRGDEITFNNSIDNPMAVPAGTQLKVFAS